MSDWRHNSAGYWSNQGAGHAPQYPTTIDEEELDEGEQAYDDTAEGYVYDESAQDYQQEYQADDGQYQTYYADEPESYQAHGGYADVNQQQQYYHTTTQQHYDDGQGEVTYTPTNASMDVNFSEHGAQGPSSSSHSPPSPPPGPEQQAAEGGDVDPDAAWPEDRTQDFVAQRRDSYDRRDEFRTAPDTAVIRRVVDTRQRIRDADARARARRAARQAGGGSGGGSSSRGGGSSTGGNGGGGSSSGGGGGGSGSGGKHSSHKGGSSRSGGRS